MFRRKQRIYIACELFDKIPLSMNEVSNVWSMTKDGKHYWKDATPRQMGK